MTGKRIYPVAYTKVEGGQWIPFGLGKSHPNYWKGWMRTVPQSVKFSDGRIWDNYFKGWRPPRFVRFYL